MLIFKRMEPRETSLERLLRRWLATGFEIHASELHLSTVVMRTSGSKRECRSDE
ncbi:MAG: hypothetical protein ABIR25_05830 [Sphingomicrobium sp.]